MFICDCASHMGVSVDIYGFHISHSDSVQLHVTGKPKYTAIDFLPSWKVLVFPLASALKHNLRSSFIICH